MFAVQAAGQEEYGGPKPLSEPQTRIIKALAVEAQPRATVSVHSGEYALYVPWDSEPGQAAGLPVSIAICWASCVACCGACICIQIIALIDVAESCAVLPTY